MASKKNANGEGVKVVAKCEMSSFTLMIKIVPNINKGQGIFQTRNKLEAANSTKDQGSMIKGRTKGKLLLSI